ncbi:MAG: AAA family ATPase [Shewanella sp.]|nr:AAA family ATPase [Shewanella sp.]MCF1430896.1 AAA family ATPase [Shewanella sp.]MCF1457560.1 AAA family ATPase [Shewanella sp.]
MSASFALLPSQEALLQRLHLNASYTRQLQVVVGKAGAGKTTLITALADELEGYNSALVTCPAHADCAEIRRKILIQLTSSPIFDDEHSLAETLFRLKKELNQPLHIIIDDAHLLPLTLWAECLVLSQLECGGKPISLTFTSTPVFFVELAGQMTDEQQQMILTVQIGSLPLTEREVLFQLLLSRTGENAFLPAAVIAEQLARQSGSPEEVVSLLERALNPEGDKSTVRYWPWALAIMLLALGGGLIGWFAQLPADVTEPSQAQYYALSNNGIDGLASRHSGVWQHLASPKQPLGGVPQAGESRQNVQLTYKDVETNHASDDITAKATSEAKDNTETELQRQTSESLPQSEDDEVSQSPTASSNTEPEGTRISNSLKVADVEAAEPVDKMMPKSGFGIQLASVKQSRSLQDVLDSVSQVPNILVLKNRDRFLVVAGEFATRSEADSEAKTLMMRYGLAAPWVRKWSDIQGYSLYQP